MGIFLAARYVLAIRNYFNISEASCIFNLLLVWNNYTDVSHMADITFIFSTVHVKIYIFHLQTLIPILVTQETINLRQFSIDFYLCEVRKNKSNQANNVNCTLPTTLCNLLVVC